MILEKVKINRNNVLLFLFVLVSVFLTENFLTTVYIDERIGTYSNAFIVIITIVYAFVVLFIQNYKVRLDLKLCGVAFSIILIFVSCIFNESNYFAAVLKCALLLLSLCVCRVYSLEQFSEVYLKILDLILIITLILNVLFIVGVNLSFLPKIESTKGVVYYWGILGNVHANSRTSFLRIAGIWMEPGICASYIVVAIFFELYLSRKTNYKRLALYVISLALTFSTTGYICFFLILLARLFEIQNRSFKHKLLIVVLILFVVILSFASESINSMIIGKIVGQEESFKDRFYSIMGNIYAYIQNPLLGIGTIKSSEVIKNYMISKGVVRSFSNLNTPLAYFSVFGLAPGLLFTYLLVKFPSKFTSSRVSMCLIFLIFILILSSSNYLYSLLFTVLFFFESDSSKRRLD